MRLPPPMKPDWIGGIVTRGSNRGRALGFPTANVALASGHTQPAPGIYAAWARLGTDALLPAAVHIGPRPTFEDATPTVEVHLINFPDRDLYGQSLAIQLVAKLRDVAAFPTVDALREAIAADCEKALAILHSPEHDTGVCPVTTTSPDQPAG